MADRALQAAGAPCCVIHDPAAIGSACSDRSLEPLFRRDPAGWALCLQCGVPGGPDPGALSAQEQL